jgi:mycothiol synthase
VTELRVAESRPDVETYIAVWNAITPEEPASAQQQWERRERDAQRLYLFAESAGAAVGCGFAGSSDSPGRGFVSPRVLPEARRRGVGSQLLRRLCEHLSDHGFETVSAHVDSPSRNGTASRRVIARLSR